MLAANLHQARGNQIVATRLRVHVLKRVVLSLIHTKRREREPSHRIAVNDDVKREFFKIILLYKRYFYHKFQNIYI